MPNTEDSERHIAVGVDGSPDAEDALGWAAAQASLHGVTLDVIHAWEAPGPISGLGSMWSPRDTTAYERRGQRVLDDATCKAALEAAPNVRVCPILAHGYAPARLLDEARNAQLLVVGTRGLSGFKRLTLGSTSHHCTAHSRIPVAVVPPSAEWSVKDEVIVGIDGSREGAAALRWAMREAATRQAALTVVNAWRFDSMTAPADYRYAAINRTAFTEHSEAMLREQIDAAISSVGAAPAVVDRVTSSQPPVQALVDRAGTSRLLVVGRGGRGEFAGVRLGSVSQHCLHHARGVVVVVPPDEEMAEP